MSIRTPLATLCLTLAVAGSLSAQKVSTDWDHSADWSKYNSYYIQIQKAFGTQLARSGRSRRLTRHSSPGAGRRWRPSTRPARRCSSAVPARRKRPAPRCTRAAAFAGWGWGGGGMGMATTSTSQYVVGTLVVDIFDVMTKQLLFRGQAQETVNKDAEKNTRHLQGHGEDVQGLPSAGGGEVVLPSSRATLSPECC